METVLNFIGTIIIVFLMLIISVTFALLYAVIRILPWALLAYLVALIIQHFHIV